MARRRSLNRRWSRRSSNAAELDDDSEIINTETPMWWKNIAGDVTMRPSLPYSIAETTAPVLNDDSHVEEVDLRDNWWDDLDRTKLSSSRRFSIRQSVNRSDAAQASSSTEDDNDVSVKKRKVQLRPRRLRSGGGENFLKAFDNSDVARSEPAMGKRKSNSPTRSDTEYLKKKARNRRSRTIELSRADQDDDSVTSNDTDIVVKRRPQLYKKRSGASENLPQDQVAGPSGINTSKNSSRRSNSSTEKQKQNVTPQAIDSNESGLMGPPRTASHSKRLSTISRKLNLTSEESSSEKAPKKTGPGIGRRKRMRSSVNPFEEIVLAHIDEVSAENLASTERRPISSTNDSPQLPKTPSSAKGRSTVNDRTVEEEDESSTMETVKTIDVSETQSPDIQLMERDSTVRPPKILGDETEKIVDKKRTSTPAKTKVSKDSTTGQGARGETSHSRMLQDWDSSGSENNEIFETSLKSKSKTSRAATSMKNTLNASKTLSSSTRLSDGRRADRSKKDSEDEEEIFTVTNRSLRSSRHSLVLGASAYDLPDKERSDSPVISLSENENDKSVGKSPLSKHKKNTSQRSANLSITKDRANLSRTSSARMNASPRKIDSGESLSEEEAPSLEVSNRKSTRRDSGTDKRANTSGKNSAPVNASRHQTLHEIPSDENAEEEGKNSSKSAIHEENIVKKKSNTARKSLFYGNTSRQLALSEESTSGITAMDAEKSTSKSTKKNSSATRNSSRRRIESDASVSEEDEAQAEKSMTKSTRRSLRAQERNSKTARNSSAQDEIAKNSFANATPDYPDFSAILDEENGRARGKSKKNSPNFLDRKTWGETSAPKKGGGGNVSRQSAEFDESSSEEIHEKTSSKIVNSSAKKKIGTSRKSPAGVNVSQQQIETYEADDRATDRRTSKLASPSAKRKTRSARKSVAPANVSTQLAESNASEKRVDDSGKSTSRSAATTAENFEEDDASASSEDIPIAPELSQLSKHRILSARASGSIPTRVAEPNVSEKRADDAVKSISRSAATTAENSEEDDTIPSEPIPIAPGLSQLSKYRSLSVRGQSDAPRSQKNIADFFSSRNPNLPADFQEKLKAAKENMDKIRDKYRRDEEIAEAAKKKESRRPANFFKAKDPGSKENSAKASAKPPKVVDKAFIVNGAVYKRPKLPRPKPWVTDRLYRHLWKRMEPKFGLMTRVKSEKFIIQLAEVVAVTLRRKKYDNYKLELDSLMRLMARLDIIKTRNDFYDFCYEFMPYEFREKATPILMPGNIENIPYDPKLLHVPILDES